MEFAERLFEGVQEECYPPYLIISGYNFSKEDLLYLYRNKVNIADYVYKMRETEYSSHNTRNNTICGTKEERQRRGYIYIIKSGELYKIGRTINIESRTKNYVTENAESELIHSFIVLDYKKSEKELHNIYKDKRYKGEWFRLSNEDILYLKTLSNEV